MKMPTRSLSFKVKALLVLGGLQLLGLLVLGFLAYEQSREALEKLAQPLQSVLIVYFSPCAIQE